MKHLRTLAILVAVVAILLLVCAGPGTRLGLWHFRTGFTLLRWGAYLGIAGVILALLALVATRPRGGGLVALLVALALAGAAFVLPWRVAPQARGGPPLPHITTGKQ